jgi:hypothetical protein
MSEVIGNALKSVLSRVVTDDYLKNQQVYEFIGVDVANGEATTVEQVFTKISGVWSDVTEELQQQVSEVLTDRK